MSALDENPHRDEWEQKQMEARERGEWLDEQLRDAYDEGRKYEREEMNAALVKAQHHAEANRQDAIAAEASEQRMKSDRDKLTRALAVANNRLHVSIANQ